MELSQYIPIVILFIVAVALAGGMLGMSILAGRIFNRGRIHTDAAKNIPYECGMLPIGEGGARMSVKFYLVAMLFILFDIEVVFLYPWAVVYRDMLQTNGVLIFGSMLSFLGILFIGYIYALKKGALDWKH